MSKTVSLESQRPYLLLHYPMMNNIKQGKLFQQTALGQVSPEWWTRILFYQHFSISFNEQEQLVWLINNLRCRTMFSPISFHSFPTYKTPTDNSYCFVVPSSMQGEKSTCPERSHRQILAYVTTKNTIFPFKACWTYPERLLLNQVSSKILLHINCKTTCVLPKGNSTSLQ